MTHSQRINKPNRNKNHIPNDNETSSRGIEPLHRSTRSRAGASNRLNQKTLSPHARIVAIGITTSDLNELRKRWRTSQGRQKSMAQLYETGLGFEPPPMHTLSALSKLSSACKPTLHFSVPNRPLSLNTSPS
jgi:hypothetical protein